MTSYDRSGKWKNVATCQERLGSYLKKTLQRIRNVLEVTWAKCYDLSWAFWRLLKKCYNVSRVPGSYLKTCYDVSEASWKLYTWKRCYDVSKAFGGYWRRVVRRILGWRRLDDASKASRKLFDKFCYHVSPRVRSVLKIIWKMLQGLRSGGRSWKRGRQGEDEFREQLWGFTSFPLGQTCPSPLWWNMFAARNVRSPPGAGMCRFYLYILYLPRSKIFPLTLKHVETLYPNFSMF